MDKNSNGPKIINENHMENCNVFQGDVYGATFPLPGANVTIHQYYGKGQKPKETVDGKVESAEDRDKRKVAVMKAITDKFNFADERLGKDNNGKLITNERLACLLRKCFGIGSYPTSETKAVMEALWVLLIDERNKCNKEKNEDFFRQTVLNIFGYFKATGIVNGLPLQIAQSIFSDADSSLAKNVPRALGSNSFPEGTCDLLDTYIDKLKNGEF